VILVDLETVKRDLRVTDDLSDEDIVTKIELASGLIADYLKSDLSEYQPDASDQAPVPGQLKAAVLLAIRALYDGKEPLSETVKSLLHRMRDPAMA
jgi:hypothetical protein